MIIASKAAHANFLTPQGEELYLEGMSVFDLKRAIAELPDDAVVAFVHQAAENAMQVETIRMVTSFSNDIGESICMLGGLETMDYVVTQEMEEFLKGPADA